ncbi:hypothetical protein JTB14_014961 [Gonioctena quinquepunctata]|nr:hypothetical protein JTB14_014961 [Gonioctena quinquepunctata]
MSRIDQIREMFPTFNEKMQHAIDEHNTWLWNSITNDDKRRAKGEDPRRPFLLIEDGYYSRFRVMISYPDKDNFEELIGSSFESEEYEHLKFVKNMRKTIVQ